MLTSQILLALTAITGIALAAPSLERRDQKLTISYCNSCFVTGPGGGDSCTQTTYIHWGDGGLGSW